MYWDYQGAYASGNQPLCPSSTDSMISFYTRTPPSTRRTSFDSVKLEDMPFSTANTPERYGTSSSMSSMSSSMCSSISSSTTYDAVPEFSDQSMFFTGGKILPDQTMVGFNNLPIYNNENFDSFQSSHGLPINAPALEMDDYSPVSGMESSPVSMTFVVPSQTTFVNTFNENSPMTPMRPLQFESPASGYNQGFYMGSSPSLDLANFMKPYQDYKSASTTPSRASTTSCRASTVRQPISEPVRTSAALQRIQAESQAVRHTRKRMKRELSVSGLMLPAHIRIQHAATKPCPWEGCDKKFKRQEHLKRHERIHTFVPDEDSFPCQFCNKKFNRSDNLKSHIWLHADPNKKNETRTKHWPAAMAVWLQMNGKKKKSRTEGGARIGDEMTVEDLPKPTIKTRSRVTG